MKDKDGKFIAGGIITGPTQYAINEPRGRVNPEVIAPLGRLKDMIAQQSHRCPLCGATKPSKQTEQRSE